MTDIIKLLHGNDGISQMDGQNTLSTRYPIILSIWVVVGTHCLSRAAEADLGCNRNFTYIKKSKECSQNFIYELIESFFYILKKNKVKYRTRYRPKWTFDTSTCDSFSNSAIPRWCDGNFLVRWHRKRALSHVALQVPSSANYLCTDYWQTIIL